MLWYIYIIFILIFKYFLAGGPPTYQIFWRSNCSKIISSSPLSHRCLLTQRNVFRAWRTLNIFNIFFFLFFVLILFRWHKPLIWKIVARRYRAGNIDLFSTRFCTMLIRGDERFCFSDNRIVAFLFDSNGLSHGCRIIFVRFKFSHEKS
jgi:hypothetical protein